MESLKNYVAIFISLISLSFTIITFLNFTKFISDFSQSILNSTLNDVELETNLAADSSRFSNVTQAIITDIALLCIFMIQHSSLLPLHDVLASKFKTQMLDRSLLNMFTSAALQFLIYFWKPIPQYVFWAVNTDTQYRQLSFKGVHTTCWILIYVLMIPMDITDFLGIKQVYYSITSRPTPSELKSDNLKHLHKKVRHPSFLCFAIIFWIYPYMSLDRFLLAAVWTVYMLMVWRPDPSDYEYVVSQQKAKQQQFGQRDRVDGTLTERYRGY